MIYYFLINFFAGIIGLIGTIIGNSNGNRLYRWIKFGESFNVNPENKGISAVAVELSAFVLGYIFLIYSIYALGIQAWSYFFLNLPVLSECDQKEFFEKAKANGTPGLLKFIEKCKSNGGVFESQARQIVDDEERTHHEQSIECLRREYVDVMGCIAPYIIKYPTKKNKIFQLLDVSKDCVNTNIGKCRFDDDKDSMKLLFNNVQCGFIISSIEYDTKKIDSDSTVSITVNRGKKLPVINPVTIEFCKELKQLPSRVSDSIRYKKFNKFEIAYGEQAVGVKRGHVDSNTISAFADYEISVK